MKNITLFSLVVFMFVFASCGPSPEALATQTAVAATSTAQSDQATATAKAIAATATAVASVPKAGHWVGEPSMTFGVTEDGKVVGFHMVTPLGKGSSGGKLFCDIGNEDAAVNTDNSFIIEGFYKQMAAHIIKGTFMGTSATGTFDIVICRYTLPTFDVTLAVPPVKGEWSAEWTGVQE